MLPGYDQVTTNNLTLQGPMCDSPYKKARVSNAHRTTSYSNYDYYYEASYDYSKKKRKKKEKKEEAFTNFWKESYYLLDFRIMFVFPWSLRSHGDVLMNGAQNGTMPLKTLPHHNTTIT